MSSARETLERLLALTTSSSQEEARNAAMQACKLLAQNFIVLTKEEAQILLQQARRGTRTAEPKKHRRGKSETESAIQRAVKSAASQVTLADVVGLFRKY
jgi:hypothetical protein